jgi:hypothetical protein
MIETASPADSDREIFETISSGPLGVGYSFETFATFSNYGPSEIPAAD